MAATGTAALSAEVKPLYPTKKTPKKSKKKPSRKPVSKG